MAERTSKDINYSQMGRCSKCGHTGKLFINDEAVREEMARNFRHIFGKIVIRRFFLYTAVIFVWGLALGAWFVG